MDPLEQAAGSAELILMRLADQVVTIDRGIVVLIVIVIVVVATASRSGLVVLAAALLALLGFLILLLPRFATTLIAVGCGLGSLLITFAGIRSRQREVIERQHFETLSRSVRQLELTEERHFLQSLNSQSSQGHPSERAPSITTGEVADQKGDAVSDQRKR